MRISAKAKLHAFERALFLKSRSMKTAGALGAVGALTLLLDDLGADPAVADHPVASAHFAKATAAFADMTAALQAGAQQAAVDLYAGFVAAVPAMHASLWEAMPAEVRGHDKTDEALLVDAAARALTILGF